MRRLGAVLLQRPGENVLLAEVGSLHVVRQLGKSEMTLDDGGEAMVQVGFITRNTWSELRHQIGMVEALFLPGLQIGLGTAHPQQIAMQEDFSMVQGRAVVANE